MNLELFTKETADGLSNLSNSEQDAFVLALILGLIDLRSSQLRDISEQIESSNQRKAEIECSINDLKSKVDTVNSTGAIKGCEVKTINSAMRNHNIHKQ